jgi:hypothetical protein
LLLRYREPGLGNLSTVSAPKEEASDDKGDDHTIVMMQKHGHSFHLKLFLHGSLLMSRFSLSFFFSSFAKVKKNKKE